MKGGTGLARALFWTVVWIVLGIIYLSLVVFLSAIVAVVVLFAVDAATHSTFLSYAAAIVAVIGVVVLATLFFIGAYKVLWKDEW
jgi:uncharacterized BrkB/YihY/UPF0761 family membrane protein